MPYIYKIENQINHKLYIGKTTYTIAKRWSQHLDNVKREHLKHLAIYAAMRKYGKENFTIEQVEEVLDINQLNVREKYWIDYYDTYNTGYNETRGGDGALLYDYDTIWELWQMGKTIKEIASIMECNDFVVRTCLTAHNISTEERIERSYDKQLASHAPYKREVQQIDIQTNQVIATFNSVSNAARFIGIDSSFLSKVCCKEGITNGYRWKYTDKEYTKKDFSAKQVCQINLKTKEIINIFPSVSAAARAVNGDSSYISKVCRGIQHSSKGFGWKFLEE